MGTTGKIKIGVLTSSRADFGIYLPLLKAFKNDQAFEIELIVFGTHLSRHHGYTVDAITHEGFDVKHKVFSMLLHDDAGSIATTYGLTALKFADFWSNHTNYFDWVFCLGDRFEMAAAVSASIPLGIRFAHIHGGETTLGAIDNIYRHSITLASSLHFVSLDAYKIRVKQITQQDRNCYVVGSLSLETLKDMKYLTKKQFFTEWGIDLSRPSVLVTIHPETVDYSRNEFYADQAFKALMKIASEKQLIITLPNADTAGTLWRSKFEQLKNDLGEQIHLVENFGTQSYFTCMSHIEYLLGNTSSGIIEAASFKKYVINLGNRQKGRIAGNNVLQVPFDKKRIVETADSIKGLPLLEGKNIYFKTGAASKIIDVLKRG